MIYLDHNSTAPVSSNARTFISRALEDSGNPSSTHANGRKSLELQENCRKVVADSVRCKPSELVFCSGGSEANSSVILGKMLLDPQQFRLLVSPVEHASIRDCLNLATRWGGKVEWLKVDRSGQLDIEWLKSRLIEFRPTLVSVMAANNETGIIFPIPEIARLCLEYGSELHTDAVQGLCKMPFTHWMDADYASFSAHKVGGLQGVGALKVSEGRQLLATHFGGSQELKRRGGTANLIGIASFAGALYEPVSSEELQSLESIRDSFESELIGKLEGITIQGLGMQRLPHTSNIRVHGVSAEIVLGALDLDGICVSAGSACSSGSLKPSSVLKAMGMSDQEAMECIRVSLGRETEKKEIEQLTERLLFHVKRIRERRARA